MSSRKKSKTSHHKAADVGSDGSPPQINGPPAPANDMKDDENTKSAPSSISVPPETTPDADKASTLMDDPTLNKKASRKWLGGGGSWRSKAPAIVKTAKESIGVAGGATSELPGQESNKAKDMTPKKLLSKRKSSKGDAIPAAITQLNVSSDGSIDEPPKPATTDPPEKSEENEQIGEPPLPPDPPKIDRTTTFGWRSWWSRPDGYTDAAGMNDRDNAKAADEAQKTPLPGATPSEELGNAQLFGDNVVPKLSQTMDSQQQDDSASKDTEMKDIKIEDNSLPNDAAKSVANKSWFWSWSSTQNAQANAPTTSSTAESNTNIPGEQAPVPEQIPDIPSTTHDSTNSDTSPSKPNAQDSQKPSGWAFWYRDKPKSGNQSGKGAHKQVGEVAVFDTPSQARPEAAQFNEQNDQQQTAAKEPPKEAPDPAAVENPGKRSFRSFRSRPASKDLSLNNPKDTGIEANDSSKSKSPFKTPSTQSLALSEPAPVSPTVGTKPSTKPKETKEESNLILPEFKNTYRLVQKPTYWQLIRQYFLGGEQAMPHLHINPAIPRIKKAVAIGVHGYFPAPIFQRVLGQPTGTSIRFANAARTAIEDWTQAHGYSTEIEQIALEGEGFISERVHTLWKLLLNWIEHIKAADFIMVACHSQGVPVAIMLVAKLIQFGCVNGARIGICAMAGVNMGPFVDYKTKYFGPTAAELFEFGNPKSLVSEMYLAALDEVLRYGVRILYVGSIDDQLVSMESSTFSTLSHPYIYRAVFVDGRIHAPDFLTHLVGFTLKLRNLGLPDHGLIRELSPALAGSLYGGEGHSRVYEDPRVYKLAVEHALETTSLPINPQQQRPSTSGSFKGISIPVPGAKTDGKDIHALHVKNYESVGSGNQNPYYLPWAMRGLLEEEFVKKELGQEVEELLAMFEEWKPTSKQLKDVKFRLEGVRSKL